ncbi:MAG: hypothetical protein MZV70_36720 [Desulfobacterales bacterium]|nr:hypothetical protein [Desulfobacterales bacterium]
MVYHGISEALTKHNAFIAGEFTCKELVLFQSKLTPQGAVYTKLADFPVGRVIKGNGLNNLTTCDALKGKRGGTRSQTRSLPNK